MPNSIKQIEFKLELLLVAKIIQHRNDDVKHLLKETFSGFNL